MQLTIIGAGAIGGTIGAHLIRDGHDVLLCDADPDHVGAINRSGLSIEGPRPDHAGQCRDVPVGEPEGGAITPRVAELARALPYAEPTGNILGFLWGKEAYGAMLFAGAVSPLSIAETLEDPRWRPLMLAIAREVLAQAPVPAEGFDGFEPGDLEGSLDRLAAFNRGSAKSHSGIYRDLVVRQRKTEVDGQLGGLRGPLTTRVTELIHSIERGERQCDVANLELLADYERTLRPS